MVTRMVWSVSFASIPMDLNESFADRCSVTFKY